MATVKAALLLALGLYSVAFCNAQGYIAGYPRLREADKCPESGFYQNANDCQSFFRCAEHIDSNGGVIVHKFEFRCPPGTIFDEAISTCNHIYAVEKASPECLAQAEATLDEIQNRPAETTVATPPQQQQQQQQGGQYQQYKLQTGSVIGGRLPIMSQPQRLVYQPQQQLVYQQPQTYQLQYLG